MADSADRADRWRATGPRRHAVVTGGAGFLGSHLCERLLADGYHVTCLDNFCTGSPTNVMHLGGERFRLIQADVTQPLEIRDPVSAVLHFASPASPTDYLRMPIETLRAGSLGTMQTLELARRSGARYLLASTSEVYGCPRVHPQPEAYWGDVNPVGPRAVYNEAKRFAEATVMAYRSAHGVDTAIVRVFNTYGARMRAKDGRVVPTFVRQALAGDSLTVTGDGTQTRSLMHVDDLADGCLRLLNSSHPGPLNLGNPEEVSMMELAGLIRELTGSTSPIVHVPRPEGEPERRRPDIARAREVLGWSPLVPLADGLHRTIQWVHASVGDGSARPRADSDDPAASPDLVPLAP